MPQGDRLQGERTRKEWKSESGNARPPERREGVVYKRYRGNDGLEQKKGKPVRRNGDKDCAGWLQVCGIRMAEHADRALPPRPLSAWGGVGGS